MSRRKHDSDLAIIGNCMRTLFLHLTFPILVMTNRKLMRMGACFTVKQHSILNNTRFHNHHNYSRDSNSAQTSIPNLAFSSILNETFLNATSTQ